MAWRDVLLGAGLGLRDPWHPEGLKRDEDVERAQAAGRTRRGLDIAIVALLAIAVVFFSLDRFVWDDPIETPIAVGGDEKSVDLPFENMSGDASNEPFTIGVHDDLLTRISRINSIKTISRTSGAFSTGIPPRPSRRSPVSWVSRRSSRVESRGQEIRYESTSSSSMPRPTRISGRRPTTGS